MKRTQVVVVMAKCDSLYIHLCGQVAGGLLKIV